MLPSEGAVIDELDHICMAHIYYLPSDILAGLLAAIRRRYARQVVIISPAAACEPDVMQATSFGASVA